MCVRWKYYCCFVRRNQKYSYSNSSDMKPVWCAASHAYYYNGHFMCIQMYTIRFRKWARIDMCEWAILLCIGVHRQLDEKPNERKNDRKRVCLCLVVRSCAIERSNKIQNPDTRNTFMVDQDLLCTLQAAHYQPKMIWNIRGKKNGRTASRQWTSFTLHCCLLFSFIFFSSLICFLLAQFIRVFYFLLRFKLHPHAVRGFEWTICIGMPLGTLLVGGNNELVKFIVSLRLRFVSLLRWYAVVRRSSATIRMARTSDYAL